MDTRLKRILTLGARALTHLLLLIAATQPARAQSSGTIDVDLPRQSLESAFRYLVDKKGVQVLYAADDLKGLVTPGLKGQLTPEQAVQKLVAGTGLDYSSNGRNAFAIKPRAEAARAGERGGAPEPRPTGMAQAPDQGPSARSPATAESTSRPSESRAADPVKSEQITVSASRVARSGFTAPTPTTIIPTEMLQFGGATNIGEALVQLPSQRSTVSPATFSQSIFGGVSNADLRGLGAARTLVLVDGRRQPVSNIQGFNLNQLPFSIVKRVEVVTGGASAAWGSDAVAGVVNIVVDGTFDGLKGDAQYGISSRSDGEEAKGSLTYGHAFAGDRGRVLAAIEYVDRESISPKTARDYFGKWGLIAIPGTNPALQTMVPDVNFSAATPGGLITAGPLAGTQFLDGGVTAPFQYGNFRGPQFMSGGDPNAVSNNTYAPLTAPVKRGNAFLRGTYDFSTGVRLTADLNYAQSTTNSHLFPQTRAGTIIIRSDNPFLPANIRSQMSTLGISQFSFGRVNADVGSIRFESEYQTKQGTLALDGALGSAWRWDAYYSRARNDWDAVFRNMEVVARFNAAIDTVAGPNGQAVCRSTLTTPGNGCVAFNPFGPSASSEAARAFVTDTGNQHTVTELDVAAGTLRGEPFAIWAGPVSLAAGLEWRRYSIDNVVDALSQSNAFATLNVKPIAGSASVKEAFVETVVPLANDLPFMRGLEFNGAVRTSDYSLSGNITSWKAGLNYEVTPDLRFRGTRSRDIRAPALSELYLQQSTTNQTFVDPRTNVQVLVPGFSRGNSALLPEKANTTTVGMIFAPASVRGLRFSLDYYDIVIKDAIATLTGAEVVTRCEAGNTTLCALVARNAAGAITSVDLPFLNLATFKTSGFDLEAAYGDRAFMGGQVDLRLLANRVTKLTSNDGRLETDLLGNLGASIAGVPKWRFTASGIYKVGAFGLTARARYIGSGNYDRRTNLDDNHVPSVTYVDLGGEYRLRRGADGEITFFVDVVNALDKDPPKVPNPVFYDIVGRYLSVGLRFRF